jgi:hypothetical protein
VLAGSLNVGVYVKVEGPANSKHPWNVPDPLLAHGKVEDMRSGEHHRDLERFLDEDR